MRLLLGKFIASKWSKILGQVVLDLITAYVENKKSKKDEPVDKQPENVV